MKLKSRLRGFAGSIGLVMSMIVGMVTGIIVINQLFLSTPAPEKYLPDNTINPAWEAWNRVQQLGWAAISLLAVALVVIAAVVIMNAVRGPGRL